MGKVGTQVISRKAYCCKKCRVMEAEHETNHYGNIYNIFCVECHTLTEWFCIEEKPKDAWIPTPWTNKITIKIKPNEKTNPQKLNTSLS